MTAPRFAGGDQAYLRDEQYRDATTVEAYLAALCTAPACPTRSGSGPGSFVRKGIAPGQSATSADQRWRP